jgi:hypothetical protein
MFAPETTVKLLSALRAGARADVLVLLMAAGVSADVASAVWSDRGEES